MCLHLFECCRDARTTASCKGYNPEDLYNMTREMGISLNKVTIGTYFDAVSAYKNEHHDPY